MRNCSDIQKPTRDENGHDCESCGLGFWVNPNSELCKEIKKHVVIQDIEPNNNLYKEGTSGDSFFVVRSGLVKLVSYLSNGTQRIVRLASAGGVIGVEALAKKEYTQTAIVLQNTRLCRIPCATIRSLSSQNEHIFDSLMNIWHSSLVDADTWLTRLSTGPARQRMASLLLLLLQEENGECLLCSREDMGAMLGVTTETASRMVACFRREGVIDEIQPNRCKCDKKALNAISTGEN